MDRLNDSWRENALERLLEIIGTNEDDSELNSQIFGENEWQENLSLRLVSIAHPGVDFQSFENGVSEIQLGRLLGSLSSFLDLLPKILDSMEGNAMKLRQSIQKLESFLKFELPNLHASEQAAMRAVAETLHEAVPELAAIPNEIREIEDKVPILRSFIDETVGAAYRRNTPECSRFLSAFRDCSRKKNFDDRGKVVARDRRKQKSSEMYFMIFLIRDIVEDSFGSVTELHRVLTVLMGDSLSRDPQSEEWNKELRTTQWITSNLGLKFSQRGEAA